MKPQTRDGLGLLYIKDNFMFNFKFRNSRMIIMDDGKGNKMRILVLGAGGIGGYFGGRLVEKGEDVTFLVREKRKQQLEQTGLRIKSVHGDFGCHPQLITVKDSPTAFDVVLFSTKSYHLSQAIEDVKPFVGEHTVIIPLLNGIAHIAQLQREFGEERVIGGLCFIETTLNEKGEIVQTSSVHRLLFGEIKEHDSERANKIAEIFSGTKASIKLSTQIEKEMWHKYLFITAMSSMTTLMRSPVGPIVESEGGLEFIRSLLEEAALIMKRHAAPINDTIIDQHLETMSKQSYTMKSSMQRDMEKGLQIEGNHIQGYLLQLAVKHEIEAPILSTIYQNLKVYELLRLKNEL